MNADSVKARLKQYAQQNGYTFQEMLVYYGLERTIYRLSVSEYAEHFVLKGGIFLYAVFTGKYERATTDIDFLARSISNSKDKMKSVFQKILSSEYDDGLKYDTDSVTVEDITEFKEYHGLHVSVTAYLDRTKIPIGIDIGFGDVIFPDSVKMDFPVILDMDAPKINAYSVESVVAEKLEAIIHNGFLNSRYKDFYDIYILSEKYHFNYSDLLSAVQETFSNRKTVLTIDSAAFSDDFINDDIHTKRWNAFLKKKKAIKSISLEDTVRRIKSFVFPLTDNPDNSINCWNPDTGSWE